MSDIKEADNEILLKNAEDEFMSGWFCLNVNDSYTGAIDYKKAIEHFSVAIECFSKAIECSSDVIKLHPNYAEA